MADPSGVELVLTAEQVAVLQSALLNELHPPEKEPAYRAALQDIFQTLTGQTYEKYLATTPDSRFTLVSAGVGEASNAAVSNVRFASEVTRYDKDGEPMVVCRVIFAARGDREMVLYLPEQQMGTLSWGAAIFWTKATSPQEVVRRHLDADMVSPGG